MTTAVLRPGRDFDEKVLLPAAGIIRRGGLVAFPTETVYGLGADATNEAACRNIYAAKGRPSDNPLIVHIADPADAEKLAVVPELYHKLADAFMPGPLTVIMKKRGVIPDGVTGGLDTVAIRCPSDPIAHALIKLSGVPIAAPSANLSGKPSTTSFEHVKSDLDGRVDMIIDGGDCEIGLESTIVMLGDGGMTLLRPGAVTAEQLSLFGDVAIDPTVLKKAEDGAPPLAPGMKYRHYAPRAPLTAIECGDASAAAAYIEKRREGRIAVLRCDEDAGAFAGYRVFTLGGRNDSRTQAHRLFAALRETDSERFDHIYAVTPDVSAGMKPALKNRLMKAAGYDAVKLSGFTVIGVTGRSGSGKSTFAAMLAEKLGNAAVVDCDAVNRDMLGNDAEYAALLVSEFGGGILTDGVPDRRKLGALVFSDPEKLKALNTLSHPRITAKTVKLTEDARKEGRRYAIIDAPLLFDTPLSLICDVRITVEADEKTAARRLSERDGGVPYLKARSEAQKRDFSLSDVTVENGGTLTELEAAASVTAESIKKKYSY